MNQPPKYYHPYFNPQLVDPQKKGRLRSPSDALTYDQSLGKKLKQRQAHASHQTHRYRFKVTIDTVKAMGTAVQHVPKILMSRQKSQKKYKNIYALNVGNLATIVKDVDLSPTEEGMQ